MICSELEPADAGKAEPRRQPRQLAVHGASRERMGYSPASGAMRRLVDRNNAPGLPSEEATIDTNRGRPIFVVGSPRSGTTLLGLMLHAHPRIAIPPENRFVLPVYFGREKFGDLSQPDNRRLVAEEIVHSRQFNDLGLDPDDVTDRIVGSSETIGSAIGVVLRAYADRFGKVRWGDKRPMYRKYIWVVRRLFPDAQFVHIVRDGRDCVASMASLAVYRDDFATRLRAWMEAMENAEKARRELPPDSFYELRYERLVTDPEEQLKLLCEFLGEPFDDAMLSPQEVSHEVVPERKGHHDKTRQEVSPSSIGSFTERLEPWQLQLGEAVMGDRLREYGYELSGAAPPPSEQLEEYRQFDAEESRRLHQRRRKDQRREERQPLADMAPAEVERRRQAAAEGPRASAGQQHGWSVTRRILGRRGGWLLRPLRRILGSPTTK